MNKRLIVVVVMFVALLPVAAVLWLTYTATGLQFALRQLNHAPGITSTVHGITGRLAGPLHIDYFELDHARVHIIARRIDIDLRPAVLLSGGISLNSFNAQQVEVTLKRGGPGPDTGPPHFLPSFLRIDVDAMSIAQARLINYNGFTVTAAPLRAQASLTRSELHIEQLNAHTDWLDAQGTFSLRSTAHLQLAADVQATIKPARGVPVVTHMTMTGTTKQLDFNVDVQQPDHAQVLASLDLSRGWQLSGTATTAQWSLKPWWDSAPFTVRNMQLKFSMNADGVHTVGDVTLPELTPVPLHLDAQGQYAARVITLRDISLSARRGAVAVRTQGSITLREGGQPMVALRSQWRGLQWPLQAEANRAYFLSASGSADLKGSSPYFFNVNADLTLPRFAGDPMTRAVASNSRLSAAGVLTPQVVLLDRYEWQVLDGTASGNGHLQFALPRAWSTTMTANNINTARIHTAFPGVVNIAAMATGQNFGAQAPLDVLLSNLSGVVRKQPVRASGRVVHQRHTWRADHIGLNWGSASLRASGSVGPENNLRWNFNAPALQHLHPQLRGDLSMAGQIHGAQDQPQLQLMAQAKHAGMEQWELDGLSVNAQVDLTDHSPSTLLLTVERLAAGEYNLQHAQLSGNGQASSHTVQFVSNVNLPQFNGGLRLNIDLAGAYAHAEWQTMLNTLQVVDADNKQRVQVLQPAAFNIADSHALLQMLCLGIDSGKLCTSGEWRKDEAWRAQLSLDALPIDITNSAWAHDAHIHALVNAQAAFAGNGTQPWTGNAALTLNDAAIRYQLITGKTQQLPINTGEIHVDAAATTLRASAQLAIGNDTTARLNAQADRTTSNQWQHWRLSGGGELRSADAKLIPVFVSEVDRAAGLLTANVNLAGTLGDPLLSGGLQLRQGELDLYRLNLALRALQLDATLDNDRLQFTAQGNAGEGVMNASGNLNWHGNDLFGELQLKGDKLLVADLPEYHVLASPDLKFRIAKRTVNIDGEVLIPSAHLQPKNITGAVQTSADARFKSDKVFERGRGWNVNSSVTVRLGDDVKFDGLGLEGQLGGSVTTHVRTANTPSGRGELNVNNGVYEAYGRKLDIKRGRLIYDDTALDNPGLDIQAERKINDITVGVYVRGVLRDPRLQFYSDPSMSQTQIVSYLIVGKPLDELQSGEATTVRSATNSLALQGGGYLAAQVGRRIGLEEVGVETDANNQQAFVLGKFLSPRLFVSYGISLTEAINTLKLRYTLSDHWTIKTEAGEAKSADVEFRIDR